MAENQRSIFIRFNMDDEEDRELYLRLEKGAGNTVSMTAYAKRILDEHFRINVKIADRQEFHNKMLSIIREEMQDQGMKLVGALLAGIGTVSAPKIEKEITSKETSLPEACDELPDELSGVLDLIG